VIVGVGDNEGDGEGLPFTNHIEIDRNLGMRV
jgi:hypothetical protein